MQQDNEPSTSEEERAMTAALRALSVNVQHDVASPRRLNGSPDICCTVPSDHSVPASPLSVTPSQSPGGGGARVRRRPQQQLRHGHAQLRHRQPRHMLHMPLAGG